ncbi:SHOCT domain-containing protein [Halorussus halophilus]|uniref:SHOCT domain-containing protein n=1 Tax=Halorussus halophilus TaxID=2650975 RepID=UPI0013014034|nr:SHOCT domain-containing protein [Halorussus halophilus]
MQESSVQIEHGTLVAVLAVLSFGLTALAAVLGFGSLVPIIFVIGMFILVPLVAILGDSLPMVEEEYASKGTAVEQQSANTTQDDPLEELRSRYARGELSEDEFERRLERLLETEGMEVPESNRERSYEEFET